MSYRQETTIPYTPGQSSEFVPTTPLAGARTAQASVDLRLDFGLPMSVCLHRARWSDADPLTGLAERLPHALASVSAKRQRDFLMGRHCAGAALAEAGFAGPTWLPIGADKLPGWPDGWMGSISHAGQGAIAAVARRGSCGILGVDMEQVIADEVASGIWRSVARRDELEMLSVLGRQRGLTLLFSAKEALYKALYPEVRSFFDFTAARAVALDGRRLKLRLAVDWGTHWPIGTELSARFAFDDGYVYSVVYLDARDCARHEA